MHPFAPLRRPIRRLAHLGCALALCLGAAPTAHAQLRPIAPLDWRVFDPGNSLSLQLGGGIYQHQRASLAGTVGRLEEYGSFRAVWRTGRIALEGSGTLVRHFTDQARFAPPTGGAREQEGSYRHDAGDYLVTTSVQLTPLDRPAALALRFGTRLPTTNNRIGLERDRTDFFALLGGQLHHRALRLGAETGVGINGTTDPDFEQADVLSYALSVELGDGRVIPSLALLGQQNGLHGWRLRGNEDLSELRAGLQVGGRYWVRGELVRGLTAFSPRSGFTLTGGLRR